MYVCMDDDTRIQDYLPLLYNSISKKNKHKIKKKIYTTQHNRKIVKKP